MDSPAGAKPRAGDKHAARVVFPFGAQSRYFIGNIYIMSLGYTAGNYMVAPPPGSMPMPMPTAPRKTPIGVLILGILVIIAGIGLLAIGGLFVAGAAMVGGGGAVGGLFAGLFLIIGAVFVIFGLIAVLAGVGLIKLRPWA